ncbi:unnamed protein product [Arctia plantaginis]|uniref:UDP-glucuronosyltransferase n=1 Tax=Arctia plantaginis TaxID=874455 RepID=A0A8S0ZL87_ARCPL|nr:unnamed protein product [Arctia plantaginis]
MNKLTFLLVSVILVNYVCSYNLLLVFPHPGRSHAILGAGYVRHLLNAGHEITYITPVPIDPHPKLKQIDVSSHFAAFEKELKVTNYESLKTFGDDVRNSEYLYNLLLDLQNKCVSDENIQKFLKENNEKFDLAIIQWLYSEFNSGFAAVFNIPYIWASSFEVHPAILSLIDEPQSPAYFRDHISPVTPPLTFIERANELWLLIQLFLTRRGLTDKSEKAFSKAYGPAADKRGITLPTLEEFKYKSSLVFGNSYPIVGEAYKLPQNYIPVGGFHIEEKVKPLPEKIQKIMDESENGVIYFSMGTVIKAKTMPIKMKMDLLKVFRELKQTVIWKLEEDLPDMPENVHILKWAPQQSILAHPNCKLLVSHGGLLSISEALHYGVPIVGIPLFADHHVNMIRAVKRGFALQLDLSGEMTEKLKIAIHEMLSNPKYREKVKDFSFIYRHRPLKPGAAIVHWVEHVIKTKGAPHLRSPALYVPLYQKLYLDLIALLITGILALVGLLKKMLGYLRKNRKNIKVKKNK